MAAHHAHVRLARRLYLSPPGRAPHWTSLPAQGAAAHAAPLCCARCGSTCQNSCAAAAVDRRLQLDMPGFAQLPATCATGIRCGSNDVASIHGGFEGAPRSGELPGLAAHSIDRAAAGWMVELCVEEWRCSLLYTFFRDHGGIVHGEAADAERVLRTGGGADGARNKLVRHPHAKENERLTHEQPCFVTSQ